MTQHFTIDELTFSQTAVRRGIDNTPSDAIRTNLNRLCAKLEEIRALVGKPITVSSGYRSPALNVLVGGAPSSAHVLGLAADINCPGMTPRDLAKAIVSSGIELDQVIYEGTWVHVGLSAGPARREVLTANFSGGHATYTRGIA